MSAHRGWYTPAGDWDRFWEQQLRQVAGQGTILRPRKAEPIRYKFADLSEMYIAEGRHLIYVRVRQKELPGGNPGYRVKPPGGAEKEFSETELTQRHEAAMHLLTSMSLSRENIAGSSPRRYVNDTSVIGWRNRLILAGFWPGPGSHYIQ